jgi:protocatechuate 3,4-dioxygenase beta subunit
MARDTTSLDRREALRHIGVLGGAVVVSACGGGGGNGGMQPTEAPTSTRTPTSTVTPSNTSAPSSTPTGAPSPTTAPTDTPSPIASDTPSPTASPTRSPSPTPSPTVTPDQISCVLTPQQTEGPFFVDVGLARADIREDREGALLRVALTLVDVDGCTPIRDAVVNIWHADAGGAYSGFPGQPGGIDTTGQTFLRGFQLTDAAGRVEFTTIYPGWYPGRTVHIHVRIHLDATSLLTTQVYFPDSVTDAVLTTPPYDSRGARSTTNATDAIARNGIDDLLLDIVGEGEGYASSIVLGVA